MNESPLTQDIIDGSANGSGEKGGLAPKPLDIQLSREELSSKKKSGSGSTTKARKK